MTSIAISENTDIKKPAINPIIIIAALFFIFGFVTWLNSVLVPYLKIACDLSVKRVDSIHEELLEFPSFLLITKFDRGRIHKVG